MSAANAVNALKSRGWVLSTAESCTAGLIAGAVTDIVGSSAVFDRGYVTYSNVAKMQMLGVPEQDLKTYGAVSEQVARAMAKGALDRSGTDIAVAVTGIAGPGGSDFKPEGRVCFGLAMKDGKIHVETVEFSALGRANVRARTVTHALDLIVKACEQLSPTS